MDKRVSRVGIVGLGLIGGSLGMSLCKSRTVEVVGYDISDRASRRAVEVGAAHSSATSLQALCAQAEVIVVATPISVAMQILPEIFRMASPGSIITDVCSTKLEITKLASRLSVESGGSVSFVGGHPMAGSERGGIDSADPYLFENALYVLTPELSEGDNDLLDGSAGVLVDLLRPTGANLKLIPADVHDQMAAVVSHLPHLLAVSLMETLELYSRRYPLVSSMVAGGFRDATRVAAGDPLLWRDIFVSNSSCIVDAVGALKASLDSLCALLSCGGEELMGRLASSGQLRSSLPWNAKGIAVPLYELVVSINDEPGKVSKVTTLIADEGINIKDIELLKIREGEGGTLRIGFKTDEECSSAMRILADNGYAVRRR